MKGIKLAAGLVRSASVVALAAGLAMPVAGLAQTGGVAAPPTDPQQGTPNADTGVATPAPQTGATATDAQPDTPAGEDLSNEVVVTGIRASLERSIAIKRESTGIVDAISSQDIGKFPDTNLAESLQRIPGVSINRRNGEGAQVTVRGFGPDYNLVTLNGRQLAASDQTSVGGNNDFSRNTGRSFDFSNLASEGVKTLEVYKTSRGAVPSGGIGATINVVTRRPFDLRESGLTGSIGVKADYDTSTDQCISCGSHVTPQLSGLLSWTNENQTLGASLFGSYQKRHFTGMAASVNGWNITTLSDFLAGLPSTAKVTNAPSDPNTLVGRPDDARYHFAEDENERLNLNGTVQFRPTERLTLTADALFAQNRASERRSDEANWFARTFDEVRFDSGYPVGTAIYLHEINTGAQKDAGFEQQYRAQKNRLQDYGLNAKWELTDNFTVAADGHIGSSNSTPDNPNGMSSTLTSLSVPLLAQHSWDYSDNGFPVQTVEFLDPATPLPGTGSVKGNGNGMLDVGDVASQVGREIATNLKQTIKEARLDFGWELGGGSRFDFGGNYRTTDTRSTQTTYYQTLGDWGNAFPRDVEAIAPGQVKQICLVCRYDHFDPKAQGDGKIAFRTEDATKLYNALSSFYAGIPGHAVGVNGFGNDRVKEDIWAGYGQITWKGQLAGHDASLVAGARFEKTTVKANGIVYAPADIRWQSDNDFTADLIFDSQYLQETSGRGSYNNLLPAMDFQFSIKDNLIARFSAGRSIARPNYGNLFTSATVGNPTDATFVGGVTGGSQGNPNLKPLVSDNFDLSLEWYFKSDSYISIGFFDKRVQNFIGNSVVNRSLYGLRDPSSGVSGRSGTAVQQLTALGAEVNSNTNLFTYTALLTQNGGDVAAANATFLANYDPATRTVTQAFSESILNAVDIIADANDPLFSFAVNTPTNSKSAEIYGFEVQGQYFLGQTGFGVSGAYTLVRGDIGVDVTASIDANQFALVGLSDTANASLIYDKNGLSARMTYNWRGKFLSSINADNYKSPRFTAAYSQVDFNVSYDITPQIAVSLEGINIFEEGIKIYGRSPNQLFFTQEGNARYLAGVRFKF